MYDTVQQYIDIFSEIFNVKFLIEKTHWKTVMQYKITAPHTDGDYATAAQAYNKKVSSKMSFPC